MCYQDLTKLGLETKGVLTPGLETKTVDCAPIDLQIKLESLQSTLSG